VSSAIIYDIENCHSTTCAADWGL